MINNSVYTPAMEKAWSFIREKFFDKRTNLIYDYLVNENPDGYGVEPATWHLPTPELIACQIPNPCGHGTGMEDSMLSAGTMMDSIVARYSVTGEEWLREYALDIWKGMELCATVSERRGFIPRSVSPVDGVSHYSNSSRDQYTHWIYGVFRYYFSPLSGEAEKSSMRRLITEVAELCEREVVPETNYNILREDGKIGIIQSMWGKLAPHEYLRLPMIYLAAWKITENPHWGEMYLRYRDEGFEATLPFVPETAWQSYIGLQLQYSLRLLWELDEDVDFRARCVTLMEKYAKAFEKRGLDAARMLTAPEHVREMAWKYQPWNKVRAKYCGFVNGYAHYNPGQSDLRENGALYPIRAVGEGLAIGGLCPGYELSEESLELLVRVAEAIDYDDHYTYAPMTLFNAWWLAKS